MALIMVINAVAVCAVLGLALLAASSKQVLVAGNIQGTSQARYAAESGVQVAMYYLQYPDKTPAGTTTARGVFRGQSGIDLGGGQSADVTVTDEGGYRYLITSTGRVTTPRTTLTHVLKCRVEVFYQYQQDYAVGFPSGVYLPSNTIINGELRCDGLLWLANNTVRINGTAYYRSLWGAMGVIDDPIQLGQNDPLHFPAASQLRAYTSAYTYQGRQYNAQKLTVTSLSNTILPTSAQRLTNPAGLFWTDQALDLNDNVTINGMIRSVNGNVRVRGRNVTINRTDGFPALVINQSLVYPASNKQITINGLCWIGGSVDKSGGSGSGNQLTVNGGLIVMGGIDMAFSGYITVNHRPDKVKVPDFSGVNAVPAAVRIINYNPEE